MPSSPSSAACVEEQSTPYSVQGIGSLGLDRAPSGGFSYRVAGKNKIFVFALVTDPSNPNPGLPASVLASKENPAQAGAYTKEFTFSFLKFWSVVPIEKGENTYTGSGTGSTPAAAVHWWMFVSTGGHREQILAQNVREFGVGVSEIDANGNNPIQKEMGTYVVDFGDCPTLETPQPTPTPPPGSKTVNSVTVDFTTLHINDCPEIGICDWKLLCSVNNQPESELLGIREAQTGDDAEINRTLRKDGQLPVTVSCSVKERDGPFLGFDDPVWENVGSATEAFVSSGAQELRINQNTDEGDVTVNMTIASVSTVRSPSTAQSSPPPHAPTGCRIPRAPTCGYVSVQCNAPLPLAKQFIIPGIRVYRVVSELGVLDAEYWNEGDAQLAVCAQNDGGVSCSNKFVTTFGETICSGGSSTGERGPMGQFRCPGGCRMSPCPGLK